MKPPETTVSRLASTGRSPGSKLYGRRAECQALDRLLADVRTGQNRVLVVRGDTGAGKTALLAYLAEQASGSACRVARNNGHASPRRGWRSPGCIIVRATAEAVSSGCPLPQRDALRYASGLTAGPSPDGFLAGLAVLSLLAAAAGERPLICLIDDEQWLDRASVHALGFAARRVGAEPMGWCSRPASRAPELAGLPELHVAGLREGRCPRTAGRGAGRAAGRPGARHHRGRDPR